MAEEKPGSRIGGKIIVALVPLSMVLTWFMMESRGVLFQKQIALPLLISSVVCVGLFVGFIILLTKLDASPRTRNIVTGFFMGLLVVMAVVVFKMNGLF